MSRRVVGDLFSLIPVATREEATAYASHLIQRIAPALKSDAVVCNFIDDHTFEVYLVISIGDEGVRIPVKTVQMMNNIKYEQLEVH